MRPEEVPGRISDEAGGVLRELASLVPADRLIVEIGAYKGKSTAFLGTGSRDGDGAHIWSIDAWDSPGARPEPSTGEISYTSPDNRAEHLANVAACGVAHLVTQVKGLSSEVELPDVPIGLLFIDGAHDYRSVLADFRRFAPLVDAGGTVVFDDYRLNCRGVDKAVDRIRRRNRAWTDWDTAAGRFAIATKR